MNETQKMVVENMGLAKKMARKKNRSIPHVAYDALESAAYFGLVDAAAKYNPSQNDNFPAYATLRISGAMCDYLRELQWGSRNAPVQATEIDENKEYNPTSEAISEEFFDSLTSPLSAKNKNFIRNYYVEDKKIREIAVENGVGEARVSQVLSEARLQVKAAWKTCEYELWADAA